MSEQEILARLDNEFLFNLKDVFIASDKGNKYVALNKLGLCRGILWSAESLGVLDFEDWDLLNRKLISLQHVIEND